MGDVKRERRSDTLSRNGWVQVLTNIKCAGVATGVQSARVTWMKRIPRKRVEYNGEKQWIKMRCNATAVGECENGEFE